MLLYFFVVRKTSNHKIMLGRIVMLKFRAFASTIHDLFKFPIEMGVATVKSIIRKTIDYSHVMAPEEITSREKIPRKEEPKAKEVIHNKYLNQNIRIGSTLPTQTREKLLRLLRQYNHVTDMVGISREIIEHNLNIRPGSMVVKQKRRGQAGERNKAINIEVDKLV